MIKSVMNPWAGLASYEDPQNAKYDLKFCGRDDDSYDVARLIMGNVFVTLYGKSGIGKTSLLNAGVFPELREDGFTPISVRLGIRDEKNPRSFQRVIIDAVEQVINKYDVIDVVSEQYDQTSKDYLWNYFARRRFYDKNEEQTIPVIVLDQFEEVFRKDRDEAEILLRQLDYLNDKDHALDACEVNGLAYRYEQNFRFTVSIREDDLYRLEDSLDNCYLPALKRNRYRLRSLSEEDAQKVILIPGEGLFRPEEQDDIVKRVIEATRQKGDDSISTNLLSLICNRLYNDCKNAGSEYISGSFVESFMKGNPIEKFYNEATKNFSDKEKEYIENHLVDSNGRRNSISENDFKKHVPEGQKLLEGDNRILQRTSTSSDGSSYRIELIHDSFCDPLLGQKEKRDRRKRRRHLIAMSCVALISFLTFSYIAHINQEMLKNKARFVAEKGMELIGNHDSYTARLLALEVLPKNLKFPTKPFVPEAEAFLRNSLRYDDAVLEGHTDWVYSASFSPDGSRVVSASWDNTIRIWDVSTGSVLTTLEGHTNVVCSASFSPDGSRVVSASWDNTIRIWDVATGSVIKTLEGHKGGLNSASFSPDGSRIVSAHDDKTIRIWDAATGTVLKTLEGHTEGVISALFSPDGSRIVSASGDWTIRIWDAATGTVLKTLEGHAGSVVSALFSPDGSRIVSAHGGTIRIWDTTTGAVLKTLEGHTGRVKSVSFSPDGSRIVSASEDKTIRIWDAATGTVLTTLEGHTGYVNSASFSPDGSRIVSASDDKTIRIWDTTTGAVLKTLEGHKGMVNSASFSPDGSRIVSASEDKTIRIWDAATGTVLKTLEGHTGYVNSASFSPDGSRIVSVSGDNTIRIWDAATGTVLKTLEGHTGWVLSALFSPDGSRIVSAHSDQTIRIWDTTTGAVLKTLEGHTGSVVSALFSPDGSRIVSASVDKTIRIWDAATGTVLKTLEGHTDWVYSASFSPDGSRIVSASFDKTIRIWDTTTGTILNTLEGHTERVVSALFSPDGSRIVSASDDDKTIRIWDATTGIPLQVEGQTELVISASFSPDGNQIVAVYVNGIQIMDFPPLQELIDQTREQFKNRKLTPEERRKYYLE